MEKPRKEKFFIGSPPMPKRLREIHRIENKMLESLQVVAPGKVILHGEHAVVYGKRAVAVSVALYTKLTLTPSKEVHVKFSEVGIDTTITNEELDNLRKKLGPTFRYEVLNESYEIPISDKVKEILDEYCESHTVFKDCEPGLKSAQKAAFQSFLFLYLGITDEDENYPYTFLIHTELPVGAGLGSSASFAVALAGGMLIGANREGIDSFNIDTVNRWAFVSEKFVHGSPSGVDNSVAAFGGGVIFKKGFPIEHIVECPDLRVLLVNTKVPRSTKDLVAKVAVLRETDPVLFQNSIDEMDSIVGQCVTQLQDNKVANDKLIIRNQELLKAIGVSHPSLDLIVQLAKDHGVSAKLTGAGGGGCVFIYIPSDRTTESIQPLLASLREHGFQFWDTILGCKGFRTC